MAIPIDLSGQIALITGSTGWLGRTLVKSMAAAGASVVVHYHRQSSVAADLVETVRSLGCNAIAVQADLTKRSDIDVMAKTVSETFGAPSIVVANAVDYVNGAPVLDMDPDDYRQQFDISAIQTVHLAQVFIPAMKAKRYGRFIGISSEVAMSLSQNASAYASGKRAMDGILRTLAKEIGADGITVNQVAPGWIITDRTRQEGTESQPEYERQIPLGRRGTDTEVANVVAFLASNLSSFITGAFIPVCGGRIMPGI